MHLKVDSSNRNRPKYYKETAGKWVRISKQEFNEITWERLKNL